MVKKGSIMSKYAVYKSETRPFCQGGFVKRQSPYNESNRYVGSPALDFIDTVINFFNKIGGANEINHFPTRKG